MSNNLSWANGGPRRKRWEAAQRAELRWWDDWRSLPFYRRHSFEEHWRRTLDDLLRDMTAKPPRTIIEVGCGPHGVVRYLFDGALKLGVDPLICLFNERPRPDGNTAYAAAIGELLPVKDKVADLVLCINVIDHVIDAQGVMREIRRIMAPDGRLVLEVHTFPRPLIPLMLFDRPHTYHWSLGDLLDLVRSSDFRILKLRQFDFPAQLAWNSFLIPGHWKYIFGKLFTKLTYICAAANDQVK